MNGRVILAYPFRYTPLLLPVRDSQALRFPVRVARVPTVRLPHVALHAPPSAPTPLYARDTSLMYRCCPQGLPLWLVLLLALIRMKGLRFRTIRKRAIPRLAQSEKLRANFAQG